MSKRNNISYIKPQDPSFLAKLKAQIGYKEGPTIETKRQKLQEDNDSDSGSEDQQQQRPEREDEKPQIVVLQSGDLTAEEVAAEEKRLAKEEAEKPADLNQPIIFKKRQSTSTKQTEDQNTEEENTKKTKDSKSKSSKKDKTKSSKAAGTSSSISKLSFNEDEEDEAAEQ